MAAQEKKTLIRDLVEQGKAKGKLTTKELNDALEELDFDVDQMDKLYDTLSAKEKAALEADMKQVLAWIYDGSYDGPIIRKEYEVK